ncbi:MAG: protein kinase [Verrucomicrobia bacterium]|nr:protein kinase [Verrucomicrobiota bacterium]
MSQQPPKSAPTDIDATVSAAEFLEGTDLANGWKVVSKLKPHATATGGNFSIPYVVERKEGKETRRAFLKVLNLRRALSTPDPLREIQRLTTAFNFERDTLALCKDKRLKRVAALIEDGQYSLPKSQIPIFYIIFEFADKGDIRRQIAQFNTLDLAWTLRTLHHIAIGLKQLHTNKIAHQDVKPSNVLIFSAVGAKVSDLGCADSRGGESPRGHLTVAGDLSYAPLELLYNEVSSDWSIRRLGCDFYLLGSLVVFFFTGGSSMTGAILTHLHPSHRHTKWPHDYRSVLPYVRDAFELALESIKSGIPKEVQPRIIEILRYLCEPDPKRRGHLDSEAGNQFNLERTISAFNLLAKKAELGMLGS